MKIVLIMIRKVGLYILSLWLLFLLSIILTIDIPMYWGNDWIFIGIGELLKRNIVPLISILGLIIGAISFYDFNHFLSGTRQMTYAIVEIENKESEHLSFLTTYIIPLICFNFESNRYVIVLLLLLIIIGIIYIRTDLYYANPTLAILGFRIYKVKLERNDISKSNVILISRKKLFLRDFVSYKKLDEKIFYSYKN